MNPETKALALAAFAVSALTLIVAFTRAVTAGITDELTLWALFVAVVSAGTAAAVGRGHSRSSLFEASRALFRDHRFVVEPGITFGAVVVLGASQLAVLAAGAVVLTVIGVAEWILQRRGI